MLFAIRMLIRYIQPTFLFLALLLDFAIQTKHMNIHFNDFLHHYYCSKRQVPIPELVLNELRIQKKRIEKWRELVGAMFED
ncbi:hypothetical protein [Psychrobacillus sp. OK032]|uniref:hypothetical protein n=1 Tax=Psychrobacillus sp. OK032 TaxID=1884358 RepID=UPI0015A56DEB|nr:hypothetical protein [Psychrobacillus sp. OK032]